MNNQSSAPSVSDATACIVAADRCYWAAKERVKVLTETQRHLVAQRLSAKKDWTALILLQEMERRIKEDERASNMG